jgi:rhomboid protease GluP
VPFSVCTAPLLVFLWRERRHVEPEEFRWLFGGATVFSLLMLGVGFVVPGIDNAAHGGGLLAGALFGCLLARRWTLNNSIPPKSQGLAALLLVLSIATLTVYLPQPSYRFGEELKARAAIAQFLNEDHRVSQQWKNLLANGQQKGLSFDELAGQIDAQVTTVYEKSFEQLMAASPGSAAPSAQTLGVLQSYATRRAQASHELAQGLRAKDPVKIRKALEHAGKARTAPLVAKSAASATGTSDKP